jgi:fucose 4-O-acetylase-like acetyltransferase
LSIPVRKLWWSLKEIKALEGTKVERTCSTQKQIDSSIMAKVRYDQVDTVRGIAILLVVLGHSIGYITVPLNRLILTFHMPLFFFISGLLAKEDRTQGFLYFLKKKARALLVPQLTLGILSYSYDVLLKCVLFHKASFGDFNIINSTLGWWFLLVLFYSDMTFYAISRFVSLKIRRNKIIVFFILTPE